MTTWNKYDYPICRIVMIIAASLIIILGAVLGLEPLVILQRAAIGTIVAGLVVYVASRIFAAMFV